jgi:hypothetical protein
MSEQLAARSARRSAFQSSSAREAGVRCQQRCQSIQPAYHRRSTVPRSTVPFMNGVPGPGHFFSQQA